MIKNIVFDLGNVILKDKPNIVLNQIKLDKKQYEDINNQFFKNWEALDLGISTLKEQLEKCKFDFEIDSKIEKQMIYYYKYRPINIEILNLIKLLKEKNYKIYILSNNNKEAMEYLMTLPFFKFFDGWVFSCDYHILKPNPKLYNILFKNYNLKPEECYFIDDKKKNVEIGKNLGMKGFVFNYKKNGLNNLLENLKRNNIL